MFTVRIASKIYWIRINNYYVMSRRRKYAINKVLKLKIIIQMQKKNIKIISTKKDHVQIIIHRIFGPWSRDRFKLESKIFKIMTYVLESLWIWCRSYIVGQNSKFRKNKIWITLKVNSDWERGLKKVNLFVN